SVSSTPNSYKIYEYYFICCLHSLTTTNDSIPLGIPPAGAYTYSVFVMTGPYDMGTGQCGPFLITATDNGSFTIQNPTGITEHLEDNFSVFPNPSQNNVKIQSSEKNLKKIELYSLQGKLISENTFSALNSEMDLNVSEVEPGMYILKIYTSDGIRNKRLQIK
ncbi:MAG: T9SS type A sorting domain-containing protein, partial [Bacteroidia bacterium]|nr:T9SS type A sorting domain-containing protein [Bacteroidia bacterium]